MSQLLIQKYLNELDRYKKYSGTSTEGVTSEAFKDLLKAWAKQNNLIFINQYEFQSPQKNRIRPDGTILHDLRVPLGYWEAKDTADDLDDEIAKKLAKGYPQDNIIFEDTRSAVLIQNRREVLRCQLHDTAALERLLALFFGYERQEIADFRKAVTQFSQDLPAVLAALRARIDEAYANNAPFRAAADAFLKQAKQTINPAIVEADIREMLIQHILTEEIFAHVFSDGDFHRENNIAKQLYGLEEKFFNKGVKRDTLKALEPYYAAIRANAAQISSHIEKQTFLKVIYERFYKVYNPKVADRLGVVYTPHEIVKFMVEGADWLCQKHFNKSLIDRFVEILDPATGTGTFICELLEHFRGQPAKLAHKYKEELHANEVAILPYYVANLNIESTYAAISGQFAEFPNLCFVDTLDNVEGLGKFSGYQGDLFGAMSEENVERIKRQNRRKISVVIGNPPYNANQQNENDNNKNREYQRIDERIKATYIKQSTAQKTKQYDMFVRFFRWASDRVHDDGIIVFIVNRKFVDGKNFDGFRKTLVTEFSEIEVVDLGGDYKLDGFAGGGNVFGIGTGVAMIFAIKKKIALNENRVGKIYYVAAPEGSAEEKLSWLASISLSTAHFDLITPDAISSWVDLPAEQYVDEILLASKTVKTQKLGAKGKAVFELFSLGVVTARDEWVYAVDRAAVTSKTSSFISLFNSIIDKKSAQKKSDDPYVKTIKWTRSLKALYAKGKKLDSKKGAVIVASYRPFANNYLYFNGDLIEVQYQQTKIFGQKGILENIVIIFTDPGSQKEFMTNAVVRPYDYHYVGAAAAANGVPKYRYAADGSRVDNITDWGLKQFEKAYGKTKKRPITKDAIFHYVYGVLHDPVYRETYAQNLKREFPRIPFYPDFWRWADWGEKLMALHIGFETVEPWPIQRLDTPDEGARKAGVAPKPMLKSLPEEGTIRLDSETSLTGIPPKAFDYRLGNRSGLDWILDQHKEKTPKDPTIREKFNSYRFADYKDMVVDLIARVTRVSVETVAITQAMRAVPREAKPVAEGATSGERVGA